MNDQPPPELRALREEQQALRLQLDTLDERLARLEAVAVPRTGAFAASLPIVGKLPPPLPIAPMAVGNPVRQDAGSPVTPPVLPEPGVRQTAAGPIPPRESLEMQIGTTWLVRAGIVLVLTSLAFLGNYLYRNIIPHLGPSAKVALLYFGAGMLTGLGAWLERSRQAREQPRLHQYAQVVFAGGLAAIYYVTYAAHYFENLRVIESSLLAGAMLLAWTAFMVFLAHRRDSEMLATVAILLAYYTSAINGTVAGFTLWSNLALTAGAVFLLRRHLWRVFPFASLLATYGSYAFWTLHHSSWEGRGLNAIPVGHGPGGFWTEAVFLLVYWALFTWVTFAADGRVLPAARRAGFTGLNNGAFFLLITSLVLGQETGWFWKWSLGFGVILLALAEAGRRLRPPLERRTEDTYLLQGVLLVTVGFIAYFDGWQLSMVLAVQTVALLAMSVWRSSRLLLICSVLAALLAFGWAAQGYQTAAHGVWLSPLAVGGCLVVAACLAQRFKERPAPTGTSTSFRDSLGFAPTYFSLLGVVLWGWLITDRASTNDIHIVLYTGAALALTASVYGLGIKALPIYAQGFLGAALFTWLADELLHADMAQTDLSGWTTFCMLVGTVALGQWWRYLPGRAGWPVDRFTRTLSAGDATLAALAAWLDLTLRMERWHHGTFTLAAGWSLFAAVVFVVGLLLQERVYRWLGLLVMAATLGHIVLFDISRLDSLGKAVSFFALAVVLLGVGFLYNKYQNKFRDLL